MWAFGRTISIAAVLVSLAGMAAAADIRVLSVGAVQNAVRPLAAEFSKETGHKIVFTVGEDNVVKAKPVSLGPIVDGLRVVRDGLAATDQVVLDGLANPMVRPGAKVVPQKGEITTAKAK